MDTNETTAYEMQTPYYLMVNIYKPFVPFIFSGLVYQLDSRMVVDERSHHT